MSDSPYKYDTLAVHAGQAPDPATGAVNVPVYLSSTFQLTGIGTDRGWDYSRAGNPTRDHLEEALAALEGGTSGHAFTSGMAAISALVAMLRAATTSSARTMSMPEPCASSTRSSPATASRSSTLTPATWPRSKRPSSPTPS